MTVKQSDQRLKGASKKAKSFDCLLSILRTCGGKTTGTRQHIPERPLVYFNDCDRYAFNHYREILFLPF